MVLAPSSDEGATCTSMVVPLAVVAGVALRMAGLVVLDTHTAPSVRLLMQYRPSQQSP